MNLQPHRLAVLEIEGSNRSNLDAAMALQFKHPLPLFLAAFAVLRRGQDIVRGQLSLSAHGLSRPGTRP